MCSVRTRPTSTIQLGSTNNARVGLDYDLSDATRLSAEARYSRYSFKGDSIQNFEAVDDAGDANLAFNNLVLQTLGNTTGAVQASVKHKFAGDDHAITFDISREHTDNLRNLALQQTFTLPATPGVFNGQRNGDGLTLTEAKIDYNRPMPDGAKLKLGYDLRIDENDYDYRNVQGVSAADAAPDPAQTNVFLYRQTVNAAYATYERTVADWTCSAAFGWKMSSSTLIR
jgi:Outer membrane protein beta-barrel family